MKFVAAVLLVVCAVHAAPVVEDDASVQVWPLSVIDIELMLMTDEGAEMVPEGLDIRDLVEKWFKGDIGLRKSLKDLADLIRGEKSIDDVIAHIKEVFGSFSMVSRGLILVVKNAGISVFTGLINKILGRDKLITTTAVPEPLEIQYFAPMIPRN